MMTRVSLLFLSLLYSCFTFATIHVVTNPADDGNGTLREAIEVLSTPGDTILFNFGFAADPDITLVSEITIGNGLYIEGPGPDQLTIAGAGSNRIFYVNNGFFNLDITGISFTNGNGSGQGGGAILNDNGGGMAVWNCHFFNNGANDASGGAIRNTGGFLLVDSCRFENNILNASATPIGGGAIDLDGNTQLVMYNSMFLGNQANGFDANGGAIRSNSNSFFAMYNSTFGGNTAGTNGGAVYSDNFASEDSVVHCTFHNNQAVNGGAIHANNGMGYYLFNSTIVQNQASNEGGGVWAGFISQFLISSSIIAMNNAGIGVDFHDFGGTAFFQGGNLLSDDNAGALFLSATDVVADPLLVSGLEDQGGPTLTVPMQVSSFTSDRGVDNGFLTDQRGVQRVIGAGADRGAVECDALLVTNLHDDGRCGSLRGAVAYANLHAGPDTIRFDAALTGDTIVVETVMSLTDAGTVIDGYQGSTPGVVMSGNDATAGATRGFDVDGDDCVIEGMVINNYSNTVNGFGIRISGNNNIVRGCYIGSNFDGTDGANDGNYVGVSVRSGGMHNVIGGNVAQDRNYFMGNETGVEINASDSNIVIGNYFGLDINGVSGSDKANTNSISLNSGASNNDIGRSNLGERNYIGSFTARAVKITGLNTDWNRISNNWMGFEPTGNNTAQNSTSAVTIVTGKYNIIGDSVSNGGNVIGNVSGYCIQIQSSDSNQIYHNYLGIAPDGSTPAPSDIGVYVLNTGGRALIGNGHASGRNVVSGNGSHGISLNDNRSHVFGNYIGTDATGMSAVPNGGDGVFVNGAECAVGDTSKGNLISGNAGNGVSINDGSNTARWNIVGLAADDTPLPNQSNGFLFKGGGVESVLIRNTIARNTGAGVRFENGVDSNGVYLNSIYGNLGGGISHEAGTQIGVKPPRIDSLVFTDTTIYGHGGEVGAPIQIFADSNDQAQLWVDTVFVTSELKWSKKLDLTAAHTLGLYNLTLLQDSAQNTSEFSAPFNTNQVPCDPFEISSTGDGNTCGTLRFALDSINKLNTAVTLDFSGISAGSIFIVNANLPTITNTIILDGTTAPGYTDKPVVEIQKGTGASIGLRFEAGSEQSVVRGIAFQGFDGIGQAGIYGHLVDSLTVEGCFFGLDMDGVSAGVGNYDGVFFNGGDHHIIGGSSPVQHNAFAQSVAHGVRIDNSKDSKVTGNVFGGHFSGFYINQSLGNNSAIDVNNCIRTHIGGDSTDETNVIFGGVSGMDIANSRATRIIQARIGVDKFGSASNKGQGPSSSGINMDFCDSVLVRNAWVSSVAVTGTALDFDVDSLYIYGGRFGVRPDGTESGDGMAIEGQHCIHCLSCSEVEIGGATSEQQNYFGNISGNAVRISTGDHVRISGNLFGVELGLADFDSLFTVGVGLNLNNVDSSQIGGLSKAEYNYFGIMNPTTGIAISLSNNSEANLLAGNLIGVDTSGFIPQGGQQVEAPPSLLIATADYGVHTGIEIASSDFNIIGDSASGTPNLIVGCTEGIVVDFSDNNLFSNNYIGAYLDTTDKPNAGYGIEFRNQCLENVFIGNVIHNNALDGVYMPLTNQERNQVSQNSFSCNGLQAINLGAQGNDNKTRALIDSAAINWISGTSEPFDTVEIFYNDPACAQDEGYEFVATAYATAAGVWEYTGPTVLGRGVVVTATNDGGNTSQFSEIVPVAINCDDLVVSSLFDDSTCGTLRYAVGYAGANPGPDTITFLVSNDTINLTKMLEVNDDDSTVVWGAGKNMVLRPELVIPDDFDSELMQINVPHTTIKGITLIGKARLGTDTLETGLETEQEGHFALLDSISVHGFKVSGVAMQHDSSHLVNSAVYDNGFAGVIFLKSKGSSMQNSFVGTDFNGVAGIGKQAYGVAIGDDTSNVLIGGTQSQGNIIAGNDSIGVFVFQEGTHAVIAGNKFGVSSSNTPILPPTSIAILVDGNARVTLGGLSADSSNYISNGDYGVLVRNVDTDSTLIGSNTMTGLKVSAITFEDSAQASVTPPVITDYIGGVLDGTANSGELIKIWADSAGQAAFFIDAVATAADGTWSIDVSGYSIPAGLNVFTALRDSAGNSSELTSFEYFVVSSVYPSNSSVSVDLDTNVVLIINAQVDPSSLAGNIHVSSDMRGSIPFTSLSVAGDTLILDPNSPLMSGELVTVLLEDSLSTLSGTMLTSSVISQFYVGTSSGSALFVAGPTSAGAGSTRGLDLADINADGSLDVITSNDSGEGEGVFLGDGTGGFTANGSFGGDNSRMIDIADVTGDGLLDVVVANVSAQDNTLWAGDGAGGFADLALGLGQPAGKAVAFGDLNGDGWKDMFFVNEGGVANSVFLNNGGGSFTNTGQLFGYGDGQDVALGDYDNDGDLDAFVASDGLNRFWINDGDGNFNDSLAIGAGTSNGVILADFDGDKWLDVYFVNQGQDQIYFNNQAGEFNNGPSGLSATSGSKGAAADFDNDGDLDIVLANMSASEDNTLWINDGLGNLTQASATLGQESSRDVRVGDLDNDGDLDIVFANAAGANNTVWINQTFNVPTGLTANVVADSVVISWNSDPVATDGYYVLVDTVNAPNVVIDSTSGFADTSIVVSGLTLSTTYYVSVISKNGDVLSDTSLVISVALPDSILAQNDTLQVATFDDNLLMPAGNDSFNKVDSLHLISGPFHGLAVITDSVTLKYNATSLYEGADSIQYVLVDTTGLTDTAWVLLDVKLVVASTENIEAGDSLMFVIDTLSLSNTDLTTVTIAHSPAATVVYDTANAQIELNYSGFGDTSFVDSLVYNVCNGTTCIERLVLVNVAADGCFNFSVMANRDTLSLSTFENGFVVLTDNDSLGSSVKSVSLVASPVNSGIANLMSDTLWYQSLSQFSGIDSVNYVLEDTCGHLDTAWAVITITPNVTNDVSVVVGDSISIPVDSSGLTNVTLDSWVMLSSMGVGTVTYDTLGGVIWVNVAEVGDTALTDTLVYTYCSPTACIENYVVVNVLSAGCGMYAVNANRDTASMATFETTQIDFLGNDSTGSALDTLIILQNPLFGTLQHNSLDSMSYKSNSQFEGVDSVHYQITDTCGHTDSAWAVFDVKYNSVLNDTIQDGSDTVVVDTTTLSNTDLFSINIVKFPNSGAAVTVDTVNAKVSVDFSGTGSFVGVDSIIYQICNNADCIERLVQFYFDGNGCVSKLMDLHDDSVAASSVERIGVAVLANDTISRFDQLMVISAPSNGSTTIMGDTIWYESNSLFTGEDAFTYVAIDSCGQQDTAQVYVEVMVAETDSTETLQGETAVVDISDLTNNPNFLSITIRSGPFSDAQEFVDLEEGKIRLDFSFDPSFVGADSVFYEYCDGNGCDERVAYFFVDPVVFDAAAIDSFKVYNAISPNGDLVNDKLEIFFVDENSEEFPISDDFRLEVTVYDRAGSLIFKTDDYRNDDPVRSWDGQIRFGSSITTESGSYFYVVRLMKGDERILRDSGLIFLQAD